MANKKVDVISVYAFNGQLIKQYKGYFHVDYAKTNEHEILFYKNRALKPHRLDMGIQRSTI